MTATLFLLIGSLIGVIGAAVLIRQRVRLLLDELQLARRERERLMRELRLHRAEVNQARKAALFSEQDSLVIRRRLMAAIAERDEARIAHLGADTAYREILAERDRLKGELAISRHRRALP